MTPMIGPGEQLYAHLYLPPDKIASHLWDSYFHEQTFVWSEVRDGAAANNIVTREFHPFDEEENVPVKLPELL